MILNRITITCKVLCFTVLIGCCILINAPLALAASAASVANYNATYPTLSSDQLLKQVVKGDELAQHELANRLALGRGEFPRNVSAAAMWYSRAASRGMPGSSSLNELPTAPLRISRVQPSIVDAPPVANIAASAQLASALTRIIDGSLSSDNQGIVKYVWDIWSDSSLAAAASVTDVGAGKIEVTFPTVGVWFVTLVVVDSYGQLDHQTKRYTVQPTPDPLSIPELLVPNAFAVIDFAQRSAFTWNRVRSASSYHLQIVDTENTTFEPINAFVSDGACAVDSCTVNIDMDMPAGNNYQWHVLATNEFGNSAFEVRSFSVVKEEIPPPVQPVLSSPDNDAVFLAEAAVQFRWGNVSDATSYDFYITDSVNEAQPIVADLLSNDVCILSVCSVEFVLDLPPSYMHSWHVRASRDDLDSSWATRYFGVEPVFETEPPVADFVMTGYDSRAVGTHPLRVEFNPSSSSDDVSIGSYVWDFGDGSEVIEVQTAETQTHTYTTVGVYTAKLTVRDTEDQIHSKTSSIAVSDPQPLLSATDASRLLTQATFGPSPDSLIQVQSMGIENWIDRQLTLKGSAHLDYVQLFSNSSNRRARHEVWWADVVDGEDQLRQRMAFALSQLFVVSDTGFTLSNAQYPVTHYYDILRDHAFGNFRELLEEVTLSPVMGIYLSMLQNAKGDAAGLTRADENFAREILQLFTIGLHNLNIDGSTDGSPSFNQDQIEAFARVFTGWNYADAGRWDRNVFTKPDKISQMQPFEDYHDTEEKILLNGVVAPAGSTARQDLELALDNIFNHPNVGPFIGRQLIQRFVTSNPSPEYIARVATVFNNNGQGVRGDLGAVIRALLLDVEARFIPAISYYGKLREPVLRLSHLWRAFNVQRGTKSSILRNNLNTFTPYLYGLTSTTGQAVLRSPSVFNFFQPTYSPAGPIADLNLDAPEFELFTESNELATTNRIGRQIQQYYSVDPQTKQQTLSYLDFSPEVGLGDNVDALVDHLNVLLLSGNMSAPLSDILKQHLATLPGTEAGLSQRVRDAVTLIMASPDYLVQM